MNREELKKFMPHREPMLLLDQAEATDDISGTGSYTVQGDEFFLQGHFPGEPVVPGVILCEMIAQSACPVLQKRLVGAMPYFTGIDNVRIRDKVKPGDTFNMEITLTTEKPPFYFFKGKGFVNGKLYISGDFAFALVKIPEQTITQQSKTVAKEQKTKTKAVKKQYKSNAKQIKKQYKTNAKAIKVQYKNNKRAIQK